MTTFADFPEDRATGRIVEIYDEIRIFGAVLCVLTATAISDDTGLSGMALGCRSPGVCRRPCAMAAWGAYKI